MVAFLLILQCTIANPKSDTIFTRNWYLSKVISVDRLLFDKNDTTSTYNAFIERGCRK